MVIRLAPEANPNDMTGTDTNLYMLLPNSENLADNPDPLLRPLPSPLPQTTIS